MAKLAWKVEVIVPKDRNYPQQLFDQWDREVSAYMQGAMRRLLLKDFDDTIKNWRRRPSFRATFSTPYGTQKQLTVEPYGRYTLNWSRISSGTRSRSIFPRNAPALAFQPFYTPHTRPGGSAFWGGPGTDSGPTIRTQEVHNHSIAPRKFSEEIAKDRERELVTAIEKLTNRIFK